MSQEPANAGMLPRIPAFVSLARQVQCQYMGEHMTPTIKKAIIAGGFALLAVVAMLGWARKTTIAPPEPAYFNTAEASLGPADAAPAGPDGMPVVHATSPFGARYAAPADAPPPPAVAAAPEQAAPAAAPGTRSARQ